MRHLRAAQDKTSDQALHKGSKTTNKPMLSNRTSIHPVLQLQQTIGNRAVNRIIQPKLKIGQPGDVYEQEADRVAEMVMRMPDPALSMVKKVSGQGGGIQIQRKCKACKQEEKEQVLQAKEVTGSTPEVTPKLESNLNAMKSGGHPLSTSVRSFFEPRFGHDFSQVRIHTNEQAKRNASSINARAFTIGNDIAFALGEYQPGTPDGDRLLAHELTHVIQQAKDGIFQVQREATRTEKLSAFWESIKNENWEEVATRLNGFEEHDIIQLAGQLSIEQAANTRAAVQQYLAGWPMEQAILDSLDAGRAEVTRIGAVYLTYNRAIKTEDWNNAVQQLNAMSKDDIARHLKKLNNDQITALENAAATQNPRVKLACKEEMDQRNRHLNNEVNQPGNRKNGTEKDPFVSGCILNECFINIRQSEYDCRLAEAQLLLGYRITENIIYGGAFGIVGYLGAKSFTDDPEKLYAWSAAGVNANDFAAAVTATAEERARIAQLNTTPYRHAGEITSESTNNVSPEKIAEPREIAGRNKTGPEHNSALYNKYKQDLQATVYATPLVTSLVETGKLPSNYVTKEEAIHRGWQGGKALNNYVQGGQIGGDIFRNQTNVVPEAPGRVWYEADLGLSNLTSRSKQPGIRLLYSNDGLMYITVDHYKTVYFIGRYK